MSEKSKNLSDLELPTPAGSDDEISLDESDDLRVALGTDQEPQPTDDHDDPDDLFAAFDPDADEDVEADRLNDPSIAHLDEPPLLGGRGRDTSLFGQRAATPIGRAMSPKLYAQASQFPTCSQLRIWKWQNGVPVGLGAIDASATEEDMVREYYDAMPKKGEDRCQFKMRPIDINGQEMGQEVTIVISEHHAAIQKLRRMKAAEREEELMGRGYGRYEDPNVEYVEQADPSATMASEMSTMMQKMMETSDMRVRALEEALQEERDRMRQQEYERAQERVDLATNAAQGVQVITQRLMDDESRRANQAMKAQQEQSQTLMTTLTSIFAQQQAMQNASAEAQRRADQFRLEQERQRAERERIDAEDRRRREQLELEERRRRERDEYERKMREEREYTERKLMKEQKEMELRLQREREEMQMRMQREKEEREARDRWFAEERLRRETIMSAEIREREAERQRQHQRMVKEAELSAQRDREHAERMMILSKQELSSKAMGGLTEILPKATGFLASMGIEPKELLQRVLAPQDEAEKPSAWAETLPKLLGVAGDVASAALRGRGDVAPMVGGPEYMPVESYPELPEINEDIYKQRQELMRQQQLEQQMQQQRAIITPPPTDAPPVERPPGTAIPLSETGFASPEPPPKSPAAEAGLTLRQQKSVRDSLRELAIGLSQSPREQWQGLIMEKIMANPDIYTYVNAMGARQAFTETGANEPLVRDVILELKASPLVPDDLNYGE